MRSIAFSIVILAGAIMAAAGTIAEALPGVRRVNDLDTYGLLVVVAGFVFLVIDVRKSWSASSAAETASNRRAHDSSHVA